MPTSSEPGAVHTGALSDRVGRKWLIVGGQLTEAVGLLVVAAADGAAGWAVGSAVFGAGTAMAYPTLIAAVGDIAHPAWRGAAVGVYRFWRDIGFAVGAVLAGALADAYSITTAGVAVAAITAASGLEGTRHIYRVDPDGLAAGARVPGPVPGRRRRAARRSTERDRVAVSEDGAGGLLLHHSTTTRPDVAKVRAGSGKSTLRSRACRASAVSACIG